MPEQNQDEKGVGDDEHQNDTGNRRESSYYTVTWVGVGDIGQRRLPVKEVQAAEWFLQSLR